MLENFGSIPEAYLDNLNLFKQMQSLLLFSPRVSFKIVLSRGSKGVTQLRVQLTAYLQTFVPSWIPCPDFSPPRHMRTLEHI